MKPTLNSEDVARRMSAAILDGKMVDSGSMVDVDLGDGDVAVIFNDAGDADYTDHVRVGGHLYQYGDEHDFISAGMTYGTDKVTDPLDLIDDQAKQKLQAFCEKSWG